MKRNADGKNLLADVTLEGADFREEMLGHALRVVRRQRQWRQARQVAGVFLVFGIAVFFVCQQDVKRPLPAPAKNPIPLYRLVATMPLSSSEVVSTKPFVPAMPLTLPRLQIVQTTKVGNNFRVLNDNELLALIGSRPALLIRVDKNSERLIFVNPGDENGFQIQ